MPDARPRFWVAPVGADPNDKSAWTELPVGGGDYSPAFMASDSSVMTMQDRVNRSLIGADAAAKGWKPAGFANETPNWLRPQADLKPYQDSINRMIANMKKASESYSIGRPFTWSTGIPGLNKEMSELYFGYPPQRWVTGIDEATTNERSKPMGLTKEHAYKDSTGDELTIVDSSAIGSIVYIAATDGGVQVSFADSVPLALNVLGYDRPSAEPYAAGPTTYNGHTAHTPIPSSQEQRDANVATAIDYLRGADIYDQRVAERKAKNAEWQEKVAAEAAAREAAAKERAAERAKEVYVSAIIEQHQTGVTAESVARVQAALSAYETARRKVEGLPN